MIYDQLFVSLVIVSLMLGPLVVVIVSSQNRQDARSIAFWSLCLLIPMLLVSYVLNATTEGQDDIGGGPGMVLLCGGLIAAIGLGYGIAIFRDRASHITSKDKKVDSASWDEELDPIHSAQ